jgi:endonuclease YncB( thermonuclease family)
MLLAVIPAGAQVITGRVVGVADGDTLTALEGRVRHKIRLNGIDAPEMGQPFSNQAKEYASSLAFGKTVTVRRRSTDRYGRMVADVELPGGGSLNREMVRAGLAWWFRRYAPKERELARLEREARDARRGLWAGPAPPVAPWEWRKQARPRP